MQVRESLRKRAVTVAPDATLHHAAGLMDAESVGTVVVVDGGTAVGLVTDRDIVRRAVAKGVASDARIDSVMTSPVVTIDADVDLAVAFGMFDQLAVRRLVVEGDGQVVGVISTDDLLADLVSAMAQVIKPTTAEVLFGHPDAALPAVQ